MNLFRSCHPNITNFVSNLVTFNVQQNSNDEETISTNISMRSTMEVETKISKNCRIGNKQISSETTVTGNVEINLPIECSISSDILRCGRTIYTFENEEINRVRIRRVSITNINDHKDGQLRCH